MKKQLFIIFTFICCLPSCKSPEQKVIEQDFKTTTLVDYQIASNMFGLKADIDGDIKVLYPTDTIYRWQVLTYNQLEEHAVKSTTIGEEIQDCVGYISIYYFSDYAQKRVHRLYRDLKTYKLYYDSVSSVSIEQDNDIYAICYDCKETLITTVNGVKEINVDTIQYYLDDDYNVIKDDNIKNYDINELNDYKRDIDEMDSVWFVVNGLLVDMINR